MFFIEIKRQFKYNFICRFLYKRLMGLIVNKIKNILSKYPLWEQTATGFALVITLVIAILIINNYTYNKSTVINTEVAQTKRILSLELDQLDSYIKDLTSFTLQPCYDNRFSRIIETTYAPTDDDIAFLKDQMKAYYYTRSDLNSYEIFFLNHNLYVGRSRNDQHIFVSSLDHTTPEDQRNFALCSGSANYLSIAPSSNSNDFFTFYHSIIAVKDKQPLAYVRCDIDKDFLNRLIQSYSFANGEMLLLQNADGDILYSSNPSLLKNMNISASNSKNRYTEVRVDGKDFLYTKANDSRFGLTIISLKPSNIITEATVKLLKQCLFQGLVLWAISVVVIYVLCKKIMSPLHLLSDKLKTVGEGNFNTKIDIKGSSEISNVGNSFNYMSEHINTLINENYLVRLNEQEARLIALEAQINPHFLYNTLQAISTEALVNDQEQIHEMVVSLAAILRYSIKGGDFVTLADEMQHVNKYIYLQKIRLGDKLQIAIDISEEASLCLVPKISIQTLVENSIVHGISDEITSISLSVKAYTNDGRLYLTVSDNGAGMSKERLQALIDSFSEESVTTSATVGVGLSNLHARLNILYAKDSVFTIESARGEGTTIKISIPVKRGFYE